MPSLNILGIITNILIYIFASMGLFFFFVGVLGLVRLPDVYCRLHAGTKCDTLGLGGILFALAIYEGFSGDGLKMIILIFLNMILTSVCGHAISRAAYRVGIMPWRKQYQTTYAREGFADAES
ncbi:MAG: monovalent cation/H(+) antiporter subunit G [Actinomycetota bacterium]|nr:monovalent cation/H(+) antiporter subunit G [Actinomycetota bacterium]